MTSARLRPKAEDDLVNRTQYYAQVEDERLAERFLAAALAALKPIQRMPGLGSLRIGELCEVPGLRDWPVKGFPVRWFYFHRNDHLDVVRLLADAQDLMALFGPP